MRTVFTEMLEKTCTTPFEKMWLKGVYENKLFVGKIYDTDTVVKLEVVTTSCVDRYDGISVKIIDKKHGLVDSQVFKFIDVEGEFEFNNSTDTFMPSINKYNNSKPNWYHKEPSKEWFDKLGNTIMDYILMFIS